MKEGRIRPSLPLNLALTRCIDTGLNEGGSNSTLVGRLRLRTEGSAGCLNEGGSNSTLVGTNADTPQSESYMPQ